MLRRLSLFPLLALAGLALLVVSSGSTTDANAADDVVPGQFIVIVNDGFDPGGVASDHAAAPLRLFGVASHGFAAKLSESQVDRLSSDPRVNNVVADRRVSITCHKANHPCSGGGGGGASTQVVPPGVKRIGADQVWTNTTGNGIGVAVIDTGVDFNHGDLSVAPDCFTAYAFCEDDNGHGTHTAGTIAARNNSQDVVGVAPGVTLYSVKVLDPSGSGTWSAVIAGVDWVTARAGTIDVANMSLGGSGSNSANCGDPNNDGIIDDPLHRAICNSVAAGVTYVVSAGNDASKEVSQQVPAAYPEVIAVASSTAADGSNACRSFSGKILADTASYFTTDGTGVSVSAPGADKEDISKSCFIKSVGILSLKLGGGTTRMSGTSMASPHVAGVAALILEDHPGFSPADVRSRIESSADRKGTAPLNSPSGAYSYDGEREGVVSAVGATQP
jgi:subtilisin family serine protease